MAELLAIDVGTQSVRALVFDAAGRVLAKAQEAMEPYRAPKPGWAEQDAEAYWLALTRVCRALWREHGRDPAAIAGLAVTTQRATTVVTDSTGRALRPAVVWLDQRRASELPSLGPLWQPLTRVPGLRRLADELRARSLANWLAEAEPEVWAATSKYLLLSGFLLRRLTGRFTDSASSQVGYLPFDYRRQTWAKSGDWRWRALGLRPELLPELVAPGERAGEVTADAGAALGLPAGTPVVAAAADKACEVLGAGVLDDTTACLSFGTTATVNVLSRDYVSPRPLLPAYPAALPGAYCAEIQLQRGFWLVSWFARELGYEERVRAAERGVPVEAELEALLELTPPGADGLVCLPHWSPGIVYPGPAARGALVGFDDRHGRAHIYRALLEGIAFALRAGAETLARRRGARLAGLRLAGGGSQSDGACQLTADVFGLPAIRGHTHETAALGAAMSAAVGLGMHSDFATAVTAMAHDGKRFEPRPLMAAEYARLYRNVYRRLYPALRRPLRGLAGIAARQR